MVDRLRADGGGVGRTFLGVLDRPAYDAEVGDANPEFAIGLVGEGIDVVEGRS